jgi:hypothetical protein
MSKVMAKVHKTPKGVKRVKAETMPDNMPKTLKIQIEMPEDKFISIMKKAQEGGIITRKELFNNALSLLDWAFTERKLNRMIASIDRNEKKVREIVMPIFSNIPIAQEEEACADACAI